MDIIDFEKSVPQSNSGTVFVGERTNGLNIAKIKYVLVNLHYNLDTHHF